MPERVVSVLIVDDDAAFRSLLRSLLEDAGYTVVGEARDGAEGVALARELKPDVITLDLDMPTLDGVGTATELCATGDCPPIVIVSGTASSEDVGRALSAGARWHVAKRDVTSQLGNVVSALTKGV